MDDYILVKSNDADNGMHFDSFQQYYQGVRVDDGFYCFSYKNGRMKRARGHYVNVAGIDSQPSLTKDEAINLLINGGNGTNGANNSYQLLPIGFYMTKITKK